MRITYNPLQSIAISTVPIYLITGDEPVLIQSCLDRIYTQLQKKPDNYIDTLTENLFSTNQQLSLFDSSTLTEVRLTSTKINIEQAQWIKNYTHNYNIIIMITSKLDKAQQNQAWVKAIDTIGVVFTIWPLYPSQYPQWIIQQATILALKLPPQAIPLLAQYFEGNLAGLQNQLQILSLAYDNTAPSISELKNMLDFNTQFTAFDLIDAMLMGNALRVLHIWQVLFKAITTTARPGILILWALNQALGKLDLLMHSTTQSIETIIPFQKQRVYYQQAVQRLSSDHIKKQRALLTTVDLQLKTGNVSLGENQLLSMLTQIALYPSKNL